MNKKIYKKNKIKVTKIKRNCLVIILLLLIIILFFTLNNNMATKQEKNNNVNIGTSSNINKNAYDYINVNYEDIYKGDLILVNNKNNYKFEYEENKSNVMEKKNNSYMVNDNKVKLLDRVIKQFNLMFNDFNNNTNINNVVIVNGYRTFDEQSKILASRIEKDGKQKAYDFVGKPGSSEHHTGLAADLGTYFLGRIDDFNAINNYSWIKNNAAKYGFILRYPDNKKEYTEIEYESWHYRYVGVPHAYIMEQRELCLEEYIDYLYSFGFNEKHLELLDNDGKKYEIYYIKANKNENKIPILKNHKYNISGNNIDGFIVTIEL